MELDLFHKQNRQCLLNMRRQVLVLANSIRLSLGGSSSQYGVVTWQQYLQEATSFVKCIIVYSW